MLKEGIKYQDVNPGYQKDRNYEEFLENFNEHLAPFEEARYQNLEERWPNVHVIGVPRSGTTLLTQLIYSHLNVGYINNLIARFWKAPVSAIRISRRILGDDYRSDLSSDYGKTNNIYEPNEFNYFWYDMLEYQDHVPKTEEENKDIDWERVSRVLTNMLYAFEKPIVFKSFMLGWHAHNMQQALSKSCFVWIRRDPTDNALSLLKMRKKLFGSLDRWASFKPREYEMLKELSCYEQVAGQVFYLEKIYQEQISRLPEKNYIILEYEEVCKEPEKALQAVEALINNHCTTIDKLQPQVFNVQPLSANHSKDHSAYAKVLKAVQSFYL